MKKPSARSHKKHTSNRSDQKLLHCIQTHGAGLHLCGKSCRVRRSNDVRPDLKKGDFGEDEEDLIIRLHALLGNRWSLIAGRLPGRTDVEVQNYWNSHMTRKLMNMGIDPQNHHVHQIQTMHHRQNHVHRSKSKAVYADKATATSDDDDEPAEVSDAGSIC